MLKWFKASVDNGRIQRLETEVADLRRQQRKLMDQNEMMIECVENISKYEQQLIEAIEVLAEEVTTTVNKSVTNNGVDVTND